MQGGQKEILELQNGDQLEGFYLLKDPQIKTAANGKLFLKMGLSDCSGSVEGKVWDYTGPISASDNGAVVYVKGVVSEYRGALQVIVSSIRLAGPNDRYDIADLVPTAPIDVEEVFQEVEDLVFSSIEDPDYRRLCEVLMERHKEAFKTIPAAKTVHHAFLGGLLMHTANMLRIADFLADLYGDSIDRGLLLAGTLLHDIGKIQEFSFSNLGLVTEYSAAGNLLGHLTIGAGEVRHAAEELGIPDRKSLLLQHLILSHHGKPEFGTAVKPICAESLLLSQIDMLDSHMEIYREELGRLKPGEFSGRTFALDGPIYRHYF